jgi:hypothetical protein
MFTFPLADGDALAPAAAAVRADPECEFEAPAVARMLERCEAEPERFVQRGDAGAMFVWAGVHNAFVAPPEFVVPAQSLRFLCRFVAAVHAPPGSSRGALLTFGVPDDEQVEVYELRVTPRPGRVEPEVETRRAVVPIWL